MLEDSRPAALGTPSISPPEQERRKMQTPPLLCVCVSVLYRTPQARRSQEHCIVVAILFFFLSPETKRNVRLASSSNRIVDAALRPFFFSYTMRYRYQEEYVRVPDLRLLLREIYKNQG